MSKGHSPDKRWWRWRRPHWSIAGRSALVAGGVVVVALVVTGVGLAGVFYRSLIGGVDAAAAARVRDVSAGLNEDGPTELDDPLTATDQRIEAVQVITPEGKVVGKSDSAPNTPLVPLTMIGPALRTGLRPVSGTGPDVRVSGQSVSTANGRFTVLVAGGTAAVDSAMTTAAVLLLCAAPVITAAAAIATFRLVRRSLRSVDAIRAQVAAISASDLAERVPVPYGSDEITALAVTMNDMLARIEAGHTAQRQFVGDASHELRSPLTAIISALDVAVAHPELLDLELARDTLAPEAQRMRVLVEDLLLLARADEQDLGIHREAVRLDDVVAGEVARLQRSCPHDVEVRVEEVELWGDDTALSRMLRNLLDNAARHAHSRIEVSMSVRAGQAVVTVADDGPGIPAAQRVRVFDRFVRLDTARARGDGGSGLGLAIAAEIASAHGGVITVDDGVGGGTLMRVQLPLTAALDSRR